jgi:hypothetical protein
MSNIPQTAELIDTAFDTGVQGVVSFSDGAQWTDIADFFDEAMDWNKAIQGLAENFQPEAAVATPQDVESLFNAQMDKLTVIAKIHPMLAGAIVSGLKSSYYAFCTITQTGQPVIIDPPTEVDTAQEDGGDLT